MVVIMQKPYSVVRNFSTIYSLIKRWAFPVLVIGVSSLLVLFSASFLLENFATDYGSHMVKKPFATADAPFAPPYEAIPTVDAEPKIAHAVLTVQIQKHVLQDSKFIVSIKLSVPAELKKQLWVGFFDGHYLTKDEIDKSDSTSVVNIDFFDRYQTSSSIRIPVALRELFRTRLNGIGDSDYVTTAEFPVFGQQNSYPNDWYLFGSFVALSLPQGISLYDGKSGFSSTIPVVTMVGLGIGMSGRQLVVMQQHEPKSPYYVQTEFEIVRDWNIKLYAYAMACIPLAFWTILFHSFLISPHRSEPARSSIVEALAVTLAVLPLRLVLVPSEILELTRIDLTLGLAITLTLLLLAIEYVLETFSIKNRHAS